MHPPIERIDFEDAGDFIDAVSPRGKYFGSEGPQKNWIFRGVSTDKFDLLPSALRPANQELLRCLIGYPAGSAALGLGGDQQTITEALALRHLAIQLNEYGLQVFDDAMIELARLEMHFLHPHDDQFGLPHEWPKPQIVPLMALAQHYGMPTRLLDWTRSSFIAAYFAARAPEESAGVKEDENAAVWAVDMKRLDESKNALNLGPGRLPSFYAIGAPRASNPNLNAQDGLFTVNWWKDSWGRSNVDKIALNTLVDKVDPDSPQLESAPFFYCFTFPRGKAGEVLWLLAQERVTAARLFPDIRGVVDFLKERPSWVAPSGKT